MTAPGPASDHHDSPITMMAKKLGLTAAQIHAAQDAYEDAQLRGLCDQGAMEIAQQVIDSFRSGKTTMTTTPHATHAHSDPWLASAWQLVQSQASRLAQGLDSGIVTQQPGGVVNHPAWTLSHLAHYHPAILSLLQGQPVKDPATQPGADRWDEGSTPHDNPSLYLPWKELVQQYTQGQQQIAQAISQTTAAILNQPPGLKRWAEAFVSSRDTLVYLMLLHESQHLGQFMAWRRAAGKPVA